ncbi:LuxR C-terminal-related transcriptional regulator [Streptomyces sp. Ac-502]|uniref:LuxR C-terminal-related transcriptional regulator n=1 Tax=Streptomyces sp. Ac-502 TaxID=3342801 RepID=UPI003862B131
MVHQLFEPAQADGMLLYDPASPEEAVPHPVLRRLRAQMADIAADAPLLIAVDDLHWADEASLRWLAYVAKRPLARPVTVVATLADGDPRGATPLVRDILESSAAVLRLRPLSRQAVRAMVERQFGEPADEAFADACHRAAGGNPMLTVHLGDELHRAGLRPSAEHAGAVARVCPSPLRDHLTLLIRQLPSPVPEFATALAVLAEQADRSLVGTLAGLDPVGCAVAERALRGLGLLAPHPDGRPPAFPHQVVLEAARETVAAADLHRLMGDAAVLLHRTGHPAEQVAARLMAAHPDTSRDGRWAVTVLRAAAEAALDRGAPQEAVCYLRRALRETSTDGEDRAAVLVDLAGVERVYDPWMAARHASQAVPLLPSARQRAVALTRISPPVFDTAPPQTAALLRTVEAALAPGAPEEVEHQLSLRLRARLHCAEPTTPERLAGAVRRLRDLGPEPRLSTIAERELATVMLHDAMAAGQVTRADTLRLARRILAHEPPVPEVTYTTLPLLLLILLSADALEGLPAWTQTLLDRAVEQNALVPRVMAGTGRSLVLLSSGDMTRARALALETRRLAVDCWPSNTAATIALSMVAIETMDARLCDRLVDEGAGPESPDVTDVYRGVSHRMLRGQQAWLRRDPAAAADHFLACGRRLEQAGWRDSALFPWRSLAALALHRLGDRAAADELTREACDRTRAWGAPAALGRALRVRGTLSEGAPGTALLTEAVEVLRASHNRLELARALLELGRLRAREGDRRATALLREGTALAGECGVPDLAARTGSPSTAWAAVPAGPTGGQLTAARLAARGLSNREIAAELGVTQRAVEKHLTAVYRKLNVSGRSRLAEALHQLENGRPPAPGMPRLSVPADIPPGPGTVMPPPSRGNPRPR